MLWVLNIKPKGVAIKKMIYSNTKKHPVYLDEYGLSETLDVGQLFRFLQIKGILPAEAKEDDYKDKTKLLEYIEPVEHNYFL